MEGYSVTEAASVLGVPTERVWELLARGILSGTPDGETGMLVFLQPRPAPPAVDDQAPRTDGNAGRREADAESSPFRELLTEFRNLTERYGQALLALGEARGEVASLRSRVDLLEARVDLRLPMSSPFSQEPSWATPAVQPSPTRAEPLPASSSEPVPPDAEEGLPSAPLPDPAQAPTAAARNVPRRSAIPADEPQPAPAREPVPSRRRARPHFKDGFAEALARAVDPSPAVLRGGVEVGAAFAEFRSDAAAAEQPTTAEPEIDAGLPRELPAAEAIAVEEPVSSAMRVLRREADSTTAAVGRTPGVAPQSEPIAGEPEPEPTPAAVATAEAAAAPDEEPEVRPELTWDQERYTAQIAETDWWMPEESFWPPPEPSPGREAVASADGAEPHTVDAEPGFGLGETGRRGLAPLPGGDELKEAIASLDAAGGLPEGGTARPDAPVADGRNPAEVSTGPPPSPAAPPEATLAAPPAGAASPASRAYRRLRRIFPG